MTNELRCDKCRQLQYKYKIKDKKLIIEIKCYNCNNFTYLTFSIDDLLKNENNK